MQVKKQGLESDIDKWTGSEFGKVYNGSDEIYIKIRVELMDARGFGNHTTFVMSFHFAVKPFSQESFPYAKKEGAV